jgi:hypothetical protein
MLLALRPLWSGPKATMYQDDGKIISYTHLETEAFAAATDLCRAHPMTCEPDSYMYFPFDVAKWERVKAFFRESHSIAELQWLNTLCDRADATQQLALSAKVRRLALADRLEQGYEF